MFRNQEFILEVLKPLIRVKEKIVKLDPYENSERACLNLGHTLAHALESFSSQKENPLSHGEAVGLGLLFSFCVSETLGIMKKKDFKAYVSDLKSLAILLSKDELVKRLGNDLLLNDLIFDKLLYYMLFDKKNMQAHKNKLSMVLLKSYGSLAKNKNSYLIEVDLFQLKRSWQSFILAL